MKRNFSMDTYWNRLAEKHSPQMAFKGDTREDFDKWHEKAYGKFCELLGEFPAPVELNAEVESRVEDGDLIREKLETTRARIDKMMSMGIIEDQDALNMDRIVFNALRFR